MNNINNIVSLILFFVIPFTSFSQGEYTRELGSNFQIKQAYKEAEKTRFKVSSVDTLNLPFTDDFSNTLVFPSSQKWTDNFAFVNRDYAINPLTVGVATLDGIDHQGNPYDNSAANTYGLADKLTSKRINLEYPPSDSIYFSFLYQPQGLGNAPESSDSLILEFENSSGSWVRVWRRAGSTIQPFARVMLALVDTQFLYNGFRFRFVNYATLSGNVDHWHLDYIHLNRLRSMNDTIIEDNAFVDAPPSPLKNYQAMPWSHYQTNPGLFTKDTLVLRMRNNSDASRLVSLRDTIYNQQGSVVWNNNATFWPINADSYFNDVVRFNGFTFPNTPGDSASFTLKHFLNTTPDLNRNNDTLIRQQNFYNYYAYDDGTAELSYGLNAVNAKLAYRFDLATADTLRAVQIFWNQINNSVSNKLFRLVVWSSISPSENVIYLKADQKPAYTDSINGFATYRIDPPLPVSGTIYIGWIQNSTDLLNIGVDKNVFSNSKMFYNTTGTWYNSIVVDGSWMMRPLLGSVIPPLVSVNNHTDINTEITLFPNPAENFINWDISPSSNGYLQLYDVSGREVMRTEISSGKMDIRNVPSGLYFVSVFTKEGILLQSEKLIIRK